jgi:hypothetical protein
MLLKARPIVKISLIKAWFVWLTWTRILETVWKSYSPWWITTKLVMHWSFGERRLGDRSGLRLIHDKGLIIKHVISTNVIIWCTYTKGGDDWFLFKTNRWPFPTLLGALYVVATWVCYSHASVASFPLGLVHLKQCSWRYYFGCWRYNNMT